mgnify:CR=1 FL=1
MVDFWPEKRVFLQSDGKIIANSRFIDLYLYNSHNRIMPIFDKQTKKHPEWKKI